MNLNGDEKRIRQLFRDMGREDERLAPGFDDVLAAATTRSRGSLWSGRRLRLATAFALIVAVALFSWTLSGRRQPTEPATGPEEEIASATPPAMLGTSKPDALAASKPNKPNSPRPGIGRRGQSSTRRHRRPSNDLSIALKPLVAWQSPTASLLQSPGEEILKSLPRLGESLQTIKTLSPDKFN